MNTFGYIAKAIGPQDVLVTLLNNLKVQERQNRVCTTVAIAIVAETCAPFTVLPALMNEYKARSHPLLLHTHSSSPTRSSAARISALAFSLACYPCLSSRSCSHFGAVRSCSHAEHQSHQEPTRHQTCVCLCRCRS